MSAKLERIIPDPVRQPPADRQPASDNHWTGALPIRWARQRPRLTIGILAALIAVAVLSRFLSSAPAPVVAHMPTQTISVATATVAPIGRALVVTGSLAAWDDLPIGTETGGLAITEVDVEQGDSVTKGQLLARLDDTVLKAQLAQAEAAIAQSEASLRRAEATAASATSDVHRARELGKNGYISSQAAEQRETTLTTAQADINVARQTLETSKALRDERLARLKQTEIRAPADGIVSKRSTALGNVLSVGQELFRLIRDSKVELRAEVPEIDLSRMKVGQTVTVTTDGPAAARFEGHIWLIGATVDPQTRIGMVYVALPVDPALKPGMFVHGEVATGLGQALQVPEASLVFKDGKAAIFVVGPDNRVKLHAVEIGTRRNGMVEILSGLTANDHVALGGAGYLNDSDLVRVEEPNGKPAPSPASDAGAVR